MTTRRDFIKKTVAGTAALSLGSILPGFGSSRYQDILGANEKIRIGVIGVNSRGSALAQGFAKQPDCEVTYICDVDSRALEKCQAAIHKLTGRTPKGEKDIRKMLESNEFEAVVIPLRTIGMLKQPLWLCKPANTFIWKNQLATIRQKMKCWLEPL